MSESSSLHSVKLQSVARSLSGLGLDIANGGSLNPPESPESPPQDSGIDLGPGLYFLDGKRKVDYVLCYKCKKRRGSKSRLSISSNGSIPIPIVFPGQWETDAEPGEGGAPAVEGEESKLTEEEKALMREEFEAGLMDAGLQIERDKERSKGMTFIRLHIPWSVLSREAELQKIKVAVKKKCELRKRSGILGLWDLIRTKINRPFQPDVPDLEVHKDSQTRLHFKTLKHHFIRDKLHMYDIESTETLFDNATRSRIVSQMISRTCCRQTCQTTGIKSLLARGVYSSAFPLHDGPFTRRGRKDQRNDRQLLHEEWANYGVMLKYQPVDLIRKYFGEQIGLYFAWLGVYTQLLIPPSVLGIIVFLYGIFTVDANVPSQETCVDGLNITMCPLCDGVCDYWSLSSVCSLARASYLFDNGATVLFAIFMSLWAACFLEHWKRRQMYLKHSWDLTSLDNEEEGVKDELRPEYEKALQEKKAQMKEKTQKPVVKAEDDGADGETHHMISSQEEEPESLDLRDHLPGYIINMSTLLLLVVVSFSAVFGVAVYRICMLSVWSMNPDPEAKSSVRMTVTTTGIVLNMLVVLVLEEVYGAIAVWLTELELPMTEEEFEERLIFKSFFLKSMNAFAPIFYVAFLKGRFTGRPGDYVYIFGNYRMEECAPPGCLIELCIQLSMIMLGKQLIQNNVFEVLIPKLKKMYRTMQQEKLKKSLGREEDTEMEERRAKQQWDKDFALEPFEGVSPEYMEMIIQYGFVSLFVASFPLAPALALLNNVIEIRLDAAKFVTEIRRPDGVRCKDIGIWYTFLCGISKFSVITNAFVISFTSEFVPRMVYKYLFSTNGTMNGFTQHSLSYFNVSDFPAGTGPNGSLISGVTMCRYKDYRDPPWATDAYTFSKHYWSMLAAKLAFLIFFQNLAMFLSMLIAWLIPDVPRSLREQLKKENMMLMEFLLHQDQEAPVKAPPPEPSAAYCPNGLDVVVEAPQEEEEEEHEDAEGVMEVYLRGRRDSEENEEMQRKEAGEDDGGSVEGGEEGKDEDDGKMDEAPEEPGEEEEVEKGLDVGAIGELGLLDEEPSDLSKQELSEPPGHQSHVSSSGGSSQGLKAFKAEMTTPDINTRLLSLVAPPPPTEPGSKSKSRCSTLPSCPRGPESRYSLPRPSHSTSLTRFLQSPTLGPLGSTTHHSPESPQPKTSTEHFLLKGPPPQLPPSRPKSRASTLPSPHRAPGHEELSAKTRQSTSLARFLQSPTLGPLGSTTHHSPESPLPKTSTELFLLKGPPPQLPRSRPKSRASTLPSPHRGPGPEELSAKTRQSSSLTRFQLSPTLSSLSPTSASSCPASPTPSNHPTIGPESSQSRSSTEVFLLKGPPPQPPRSRHKSRASTLPSSHRASGPEELPAKTSQSSTFTER